MATVLQTDEGLIVHINRENGTEQTTRYHSFQDENGDWHNIIIDSATTSSPF